MYGHLVLTFRSLVRYGAYALLGCVALAGIGWAAALMLSVKVSGDSMMPTLQPGDRLVVNLWHRHDVRRFDLVVAHRPDLPSESIIKRVIGMPGDRITVLGGARPTVLVRPAGSAVTYAVQNPAWDDQIGFARASCCQVKGVSMSAIGVPGAWVTVPDAAYWVIGDNWGGSVDSRSFGFVAASHVQSRVAFRMLPFGRQGPVPDPATLVRKNM